MICYFSVFYLYKSISYIEYSEFVPYYTCIRVFSKKTHNIWCVYFFLVHGNWGSWLSWSECSASCEGGIQTRERYCNNPTADRYGSACVGRSTSNQSCNIDPCPGMNSVNRAKCYIYVQIYLKRYNAQNYEWNASVCWKKLRKRNI